MERMSNSICVKNFTGKNNDSRSSSSCNVSNNNNRDGLDGMSSSANSQSSSISQSGSETFFSKLKTLKERVKTIKNNIRSKHYASLQALQPKLETVRDSNQLPSCSMANFKVKLQQPRRTSEGQSSQETAVSATTGGVIDQGQKISTSIKSRQQLEDEVDGLRELVQQLTIENPDLIKLVKKLYQEIPKLNGTDLFLSSIAVPSAIISQNTDNRRLISGRSVDSSTSAPDQVSCHHSEASNASSNQSNNNYTNPNKYTAFNNKINDKKKRKRGRRHNKRTHRKSEATELEALAKYINDIVCEYLEIENPEELAKYLRFQGDLERLEKHATRLAEAGLGRIVEAEIRVNRKNNHQSFVTMSNGRESIDRDGMVMLPIGRRYAFDGDIVRAFVLNQKLPTNNITPVSIECHNSNYVKYKDGKNESICSGDDKDHFDEKSESNLDINDFDNSAVATSDNCPKAFVISIIKQTNLREIVGTITFMNPVQLNDGIKYYKLKPNDMRIPMVYIAEHMCGLDTKSAKSEYACGMLFLAKVIETDVNGHCIGELLKPIGKVGDLSAEVKAILLHNNLKNITPYEQRFVDLYDTSDEKISNEEKRKRMDLRSKCIFTIDPLTARDLDDAVSIEKLGDNEFEIGVHISDVSHYISEDSELDNIIKDRTTSIYLVNGVIHMLPETLCMRCSLLPGKDKYAFSVHWCITSSGDLLGKPTFTRSIIRSCTQLAYEHAQKIINHPKEIFDIDDFPTICNGFEPTDIVERVLLLNSIAKNLRAKRYEGGALSINNPKIRFDIDFDTGEPKYLLYEERKEANFLIEELMLLANQYVARFIYEHFPEIAILRNHAPPLLNSMKNVREKLLRFGFDLDISSSKTVYESMQRICSSSENPEAMDACLNQLLTKPMARAEYFCSGKVESQAELWHYALSIPIYTHFTSPIRRYPDILVHRLLAAALSYCPPPKRTTDELKRITEVCNEQKYNAKMAGEESVNLFFKRFIEKKQSITLRAAIFEIFRHCASVVIIQTGHFLNINYRIQKVLIDTSEAPNSIYIREENSKLPPTKLELFSTVYIKIVVRDNKITGLFLSPDRRKEKTK